MSLANFGTAGSPDYHKLTQRERQREKMLKVSFSVTEIEVERFEISCLLLYSPIKGAFGTIQAGKEGAFLNDAHIFYDYLISM